MKWLTFLTANMSGTAEQWSFASFQETKLFLFQNKSYQYWKEILLVKIQIYY